MGTDQQFSLKWNKYRRNWSCFLGKLLRTRLLSDVVVACDGRLFNLHRLVLASCSLYFERTLQDVPIKETPVVVLNGVSGREMELLVRFMYCGEATVDQPQLEPLLKAAERLQIKGLVKSDGESSDDDDDEEASGGKRKSDDLLSVPLSVPHQRPPAGARNRRRSAARALGGAGEVPGGITVLNGSSDDDDDGDYDDDSDYSDGSGGLATKRAKKNSPLQPMSLCRSQLRIPGSCDSLRVTPAAAVSSGSSAPSSATTTPSLSVSALARTLIPSTALTSAADRAAAALLLSKRKLSDSAHVHEALLKIATGDITVSEASLKYDIPIPTLYVNMRRVGIRARGRISTSGVRKPRGVISSEMSQALEEIRRGCITASKASRKYNITLPRIMSWMRKMGIRSAFAKSNATVATLSTSLPNPVSTASKSLPSSLPLTSTSTSASTSTSTSTVSTSSTTTTPAAASVSKSDTAPVSVSTTVSSASALALTSASSAAERISTDSGDRDSSALESPPISMKLGSSQSAARPGGASTGRHSVPTTPTSRRRSSSGEMAGASNLVVSTSGGCSSSERLAGVTRSPGNASDLTSPVAADMTLHHQPRQHERLPSAMLPLTDLSQLAGYSQAMTGHPLGFHHHHHPLHQHHQHHQHHQQQVQHQQLMLQHQHHQQQLHQHLYQQQQQHQLPQSQQPPHPQQHHSQSQQMLQQSAVEELLHHLQQQQQAGGTGVSVPDSVPYLF